MTGHRLSIAGCRMMEPPNSGIRILTEAFCDVDLDATATQYLRDAPALPLTLAEVRQRETELDIAERHFHLPTEAPDTRRAGEIGKATSGWLFAAVALLFARELKNTGDRRQAAEKVAQLLDMTGRFTGPNWVLRQEAEGRLIWSSLRLEIGAARAERFLGAFIHLMKGLPRFRPVFSRAAARAAA